MCMDLDLKNLQSLEICGGGLTDAGVKNIKQLSSLTLLNLSQNCNLTDKTLEMISGMFFYLCMQTCHLTTGENKQIFSKNSSIT